MSLTSFDPLRSALGLALRPDLLPSLSAKVCSGSSSPAAAGASAALPMEEPGAPLAEEEEPGAVLTVEPGALLLMMGATLTCEAEPMELEREAETSCRQMR